MAYYIVGHNMNNAVEFNGYHATDQKHVASIMSTGFCCKHNKDHWLGNGCYFFEDIALTKAWANNPPYGYGEIYAPALLSVHIVAEQDKTLSLQRLDDYNDVRDAFQSFCECIWNDIVIGLGLDPKDITYETMRCSFFDWLRDEWELDIIVAGFERYFARYIPRLSSETYQTFKKFKIPYLEIQYCVFNNKVIVDMEHLEG